MPPTLQAALNDPELTLVQAHIFARHGERTPVRRRLQHLVPSPWALCKTGTCYDAPTLTATGDLMSLPIERQSEIAASLVSEHPSPANNICTEGQLTDLGRRSCYDLGAQIAQQYFQHLNVSGGSPAEHFAFRSTPMQRTIESLQQVIGGMFERSPLKRPAKILVRERALAIHIAASSGVDAETPCQRKARQSFLTPSTVPLLRHYSSNSPLWQQQRMTAS